MSDPRRLRGGAASTTKKAIPAPRGLSTLSKIRAALSLGRIVLINVLALIVTAAVTVHVATRPRSPGPGAAAPERASSAGPPPVAPAASTGAAAAPIEVDFEGPAPAVTARVPTAPTVDGAAGLDR
jgi:hypothetical protein